MAYGFRIAGNATIAVFNVVVPSIRFTLCTCVEWIRTKESHEISVDFHVYFIIMTTENIIKIRSMMCVVFFHISTPAYTD